jgi:enediyne biosynthesis protein CalE2
MAADDSDARPEARPSLRVRLAAGRPLVLDGATGTELERRGVRADLPLWSSWGLLEAPAVVREIHLDYLRAGVDVLTAATFRTHARSLAAAGCAGRAGRAAELCARALGLAREASELAQRDAWLLGSAAPLEDCYHPERVPDAETLAREHAQHARHLVRAGADAILIETIGTLREGVAALRAARDAGAEALISFVCAEDARLLSGEPLAEALAAVAPFAPLAVGVNCLPTRDVPACLPSLRGAGAPFLIYANLGGETGHASPAAFAAAAQGWVAAGAACVGGCCGSTPAHLRALVERLRSATPRASAQ